MTPELFFQKFDQLADAPNAVAKMRELVLDLAAKGHLVPLERSWITCPLKQLATKIGSGSTPTGGREAYLSEGIPLIRSMNVYFSGFTHKGLAFISEEQARKLSNVVVQSGDVLLNITGASIGRVTIAPAEMAGARVNQHVAIIRPNARLVPRFLALFLASPTVQHMIAEIEVGATRQALTKAMIEQFEVPVPSVAEQCAVIDKVDELMALCDRLEAQQREREERQAVLARAALARFTEAPTPENLRFLFHGSYEVAPAELRKTILTLAVRGKLVPQEASDEPVTNWLTRINGGGNYANESCGEPLFVVPRGWLRMSLATIFEVAGGIQKTPLRAPKANAFPYVSVGNVGRGRIDLKEVKRFELSDGELERRRLEPGDVLIVEGNGSFNEIGRCAKWNGEIQNCVHQNHVIRCRPVDPNISDFVIAYLNSPVGTEIMQRLAITTSGLYSLSVGKIRQIEIALPPLAEQKRIVAKVDDLMALVDRLEAQLTESRAAGARLLEAVVAELTAAERGVEPAAGREPARV